MLSAGLIPHNSIHLLIITADFVTLYWTCPCHYHFISCQCLLNSKVLFCFSDVIMSIKLFFLFTGKLVRDVKKTFYAKL